MFVKVGKSDCRKCVVVTKLQWQVFLLSLFLQSGNSRNIVTRRGHWPCNNLMHCLELCDSTRSFLYILFDLKLRGQDSLHQYRTNIMKYPMGYNISNWVFKITNWVFFFSLICLAESEILNWVYYPKLGIWYPQLVLLCPFGDIICSLSNEPYVQKKSLVST